MRKEKKKVVSRILDNGVKWEEIKNAIYTIILVQFMEDAFLWGNVDGINL